MLPHPYSIDVLAKRYFDGVDNKNMAKVLDSLTDDAILTEVTSNTVHNGKDAIEAMFTRLFSDFSSIWHGNFVHVTDLESNSICSQFTVLITPNGGSGLRYEPMLSRAELIDLALIQYFGNIDAKNIDAVLDCFHDEALMCAQTAFIAAPWKMRFVACSPVSWVHMGRLYSEF